ncbi:MAG TPA: hypothetical protein VFG78_05895 [Gemmatimonadota bacterium]|nr:hypothetical protein [Gemmatimonadota bacterium]
MLSALDGHLPGYGPTAQMTIEVLSPVPEVRPDGSLRLPWSNSDGITKNGNSVILRIRIGKVRILLGGDLNHPFERVERSVAVYDTINLRTDGEQVVIAQKLERPRPNGEKCDAHRLELDESVEFKYLGDVRVLPSAPSLFRRATILRRRDFAVLKRPGICLPSPMRPST